MSTAAHSDGEGRDSQQESGCGTGAPTHGAAGVSRAEDGSPLLWSLFDTAVAVVDAFEALGQRDGLSMARFRVLRALVDTPGGRALPSDLADRCGFARSTMTTLLDGLERSALVERLPRGRNRKIQPIGLTAGGRTHAAMAIELRESRLTEVSQRLTSDQVAMIQVALPLLRRLVSEVQGAGPTGEPQSPGAG